MIQTPTQDKFSHASPQSIPTPTALEANTSLGFFPSEVLLVLEFHKWNHIVCILFGKAFFTLSLTVRFVQVLCYLQLAPFYCEQYSIVCTYQFVHSATHRTPGLFPGCSYYGYSCTSTFVDMFSFLLGRHIGVELPGHGVAYIYFCMKLPDLYPKTISITLKKVLQLINSGYQGKKLRMTVDLLIIHICIVKIQTMVLLLKRTKV